MFQNAVPKKRTMLYKCIECQLNGDPSVKYDTFPTGSNYREAIVRV